MLEYNLSVKIRKIKCLVNLKCKNRSDVNKFSVATPCMVIFKCNFKKASRKQEFSLFYKQFPIGL